jgi:hypothetical protein
MTTKCKRDPIEIRLTDYILEEFVVPPGVRLLFFDDTKILSCKLDRLGHTKEDEENYDLPEVKLFFDGMKISRFGNSARWPVHIHYSKSYCRGEFAKRWKTVKVK